MNIFVLYAITNIEASACAACITLTADIIAFFIFLIFIKAFGSGDSKITIFQLYLNFIFLKSRKIYIQFIAFISLTYIQNKGREKKRRASGCSR